MRLVLLSLGLVACGPTVDVPVDSDSDSDSESTSGGSTSATPASTTSTVTTSPPPPTTLPPTGGPLPTTGLPPATDGVDESSSSSGEDACGPIEEFEALVTVDNGGDPGPATFQCMVTNVETGPSALEVELFCDGVTHNLRIQPLEAAIPEGIDVVLDVNWTSDSFDSESVVKLTALDGRLLLAASNSAVFPGQGDVPADFFAPLSTELVSELCEFQTLPGGDFVGPCYEYQREAIRFTHDGATEEVLDRNRGTLPGFAIAVAEAEIRQELNCAEPPQWYQWVVYTPLAP